MSLHSGYAGMIAAGVLVAAGVVAGGHRIVDMSEKSSEPADVTVEYGWELLRNTAAYMGPDHDDPNMRYSGTHIACASCHLDVGQRPGTLSLLETADRYPRMSGRDGGVRDIKDRINGCMQRSMNGSPLPRESTEMLAMVKYIDHLGDVYKAMSEIARTPIEPPAFQEPDRAADVGAGRIVFEARCQVCHGADGAGLKATPDPANGYLFPPLWGPDSYNNGAGMTRVLTAARFIKARMPYGQPDLTDDEAYDVAAYINSHWRPEKDGLEADYPDRAMKPIDSPYGPYADDFPHEQHRIGPFKPIREYYENLEKEEGERPKGDEPL